MLQNIEKIYFIGIKGVAMSGLAVICKQMGYKVTGSDVAEKFITDKILHNNRIKIFSKFSVNNIKKSNPDLIVVGTSWSKDNSEYKYAKQNKINIVIESELRGHLSQKKYCIAITGVHGKTTISAWLSYIFSQANLKPSYLFGTAEAYGLRANGRWQNGKHFIVEGDEYVKSLRSKKAKFLDLSPKISLITSLEWEHVDVYKNLRAVEQAFVKLINNTAKNHGKVFACTEWQSIKKIIKNKKNIITYGFESNVNWQAYDISFRRNATHFKVKKNKRLFGQFKIKLLGEHNLLNALACIAISQSQGIKKNKIAKSLFKFEGTQRRFKLKRQKGVIYIDDYAHHPTEIKATLQAVRQKFPDKFTRCVFQPHTFSRTKALMDDFSKSFLACNQIVFTDIFASAREAKKAVDSKKLAKKTKNFHTNVKYIGKLKNVDQYIKKNTKKGEVVIIMGAGDVYKLF